MGVLENLPLRGVVMHLLLILVGFAIGFEVHDVSQVFNTFKNIGDGGISP